MKGALEGLLEVSRADAAALLPFASFLNSLLDYLERFDDAALQAREREPCARCCSLALHNIPSARYTLSRACERHCRSVHAISKRSLYLLLKPIKLGCGTSAHPQTMFRVFTDMNGAALADSRHPGGRAPAGSPADDLYSPSQPALGFGTQRNSGGGAGAAGGFSLGGGACDELHVVLRKQLYSRDVRFKRIGVLGSVQLISRLHAAGAAAGGASRAHPAVRNILETTLDAVRPCVPAEALLYDLLAELSERGELCETVRRLVHEACCNDFETHSLDDFTEVRVEESRAFLRLPSIMYTT